MTERIPKISDAEMEVMRIVWEAEKPITSNEILQKQSSGKEWKITTILTLASRLMEKGLLTSSRKGKAHCYSPLVTEVEYKKSQTKTFLESMFGGSIKSFIATLCDGEDVSREELEELKKWLSKR